MTNITNVWNWLNGKKTIIGAALLVAGTVASGGVAFIPAIPLLAPEVPYMLGIGTFFGGLGLAHKFLGQIVAPATP